MPLNIDWQQILLHLFNFSLLSLGLYILLYKPVKNFMDARTAYYEGLEKETEVRLANAKVLEEAKQKELDNVHAEMDKVREKILKESQEQAKQNIESSKEQGKHIIEQAKQNANKEHEAIINDAKKEIRQMAITATEKIVAKDQDIFDEFIEATND